MDYFNVGGGSFDSSQEPGLASGLAGLGHDEDDDDDINNTLYELTDLQEYTARKVEPDDLKVIRALLKDEDYSQFHFEDPVVLFETCCFSLAVFDVIESDRLVAAAFFDDKPAKPDLMKSAKKWKSSYDLKSMAPINTLHLRCFVCNPEVAEDVCLTEIISHTFSSSIHIEYIVVEMPSQGLTGPYLFSSLVKELEVSDTNANHREKRKLIVYKKDLLMPHLLVREGREHDLDDLSPLLPMDQQMMEQHFNKVNLSDIIAMSEKGNQSMVAEWKGDATGIISVSSDLDYELLNNFFHLEPFHGLRKPHKNDKIFVNDDRVKNMMDDVKFDDLFMEAEKSFQMRQASRGQVRIQRQEAARQPYDVELIKEFSMADGGFSDDESSGLEKIFDDKAKKPHQFTTKVSEDILLYGLRRRLPVEELDDSNSLSITGSKSEVTGSTLRGHIKGLEDDEDEDENEDEEEDEGNEGDEEDAEVVEVIDGDDLIIPSETPLVESGGVHAGEAEDLEAEEGEDEEMLSNVVTIEDGEEEEAGEEVEENGLEEGLELEVTTPSVLGDEIALGDLEEQAGEDGEIVETLIVPETQGGLSVAESPARETSVPETDTALVSAVPSRKRSGGGDSALSPTDSEIARNLAAEEAAADEEHVSATDQQSLMPQTQGQGTAQDKTGLQSRTQFVTEKNIAMLQQMSPEVRRRISEDTLYVGKRIPARSFDQKVELFKKVWDVYNMIQEDGMTLQQAQEMITPADMDALEEAQVVTTGSLLKYITALLPSESRYPFERTEQDLNRRKSAFCGIANALAVKMFNMNKKHMLRHMDLFREIFKPFPNREYLVVTVPVGGNVREPPWLQNFIRVIPRVESSYPRDLFVLHKVAITSKVRVRKAKNRDVAHVKEFLSSLLDKDKIYRDFMHCFGKTDANRMFVSHVPKISCYIAHVKNYEGSPIIGLAMVSTETEVLKYSVNYDLEKHTYFAAHDVVESHGYLHHFLVNPVFQRHSKLILKEVMRLNNKQCLFHRVYPEHASSELVEHQSIINNMEDWIPIMPRKRLHYEDLGLTDIYDDERQPPPYVQDMGDPYALIHIGKKFILDPKIMLTKRLVFVGASTTTISCLEKLVSSTYRCFKYLTVIDPFGLPGTLPYDPVRNEFFGLRNGGVKMSYESDAEWVQRTGIHLWVQVVLGRVTSIVRDAKYVVVNSDYVVPYDKLVLAPGQQFQRLDCPEPEINDPNFTAFKKNTATHELQETKELKFTRYTPKPKNVFMINTEVEANMALEFLKKYQPFIKKKKLIIFGGGLPTFCCVRALLAAGISSDRIVLVTTHDKDIPWEKQSGYILSSKVRDPMRLELQNMGVSVVDNYEFSHWETCSLSGLVKRTHFKSLTERDAHISFSTFALFCYRYRRVDDEIVSALSEAYLVYQDGIVIDAGFRTNDHNIYAAGPAATYQKILLADNMNHVYYQSEEIGAKLADFLIESIETEGEGIGKMEELNVIKFKKPLIRAVKLLGDWYYMYLRSPGNHSRCTNFHGAASCEESCECTTEVVTGSVKEEEDPNQRFFKLRLDDRHKIVSFECMSKSKFSFSNMSALYGQHETLLNQLMARLESGECTDLYNHFQQSWFSVFCIDEWDSFQSELKDLYRQHDIGSGGKLIEFLRDFIANLDNPEALRMDPNIIRSIWRSSGLKDIVEEKLLNFLKFHRLSLPMYANHHYVEDLLEERSTSTLYYPNTKAHMVQ